MKFKYDECNLIQISNKFYTSETEVKMKLRRIMKQIYN